MILKAGDINRDDDRLKRGEVVHATSIWMASGQRYVQANIIRLQFVQGLISQGLQSPILCNQVVFQVLRPDEGAET